jgi:PRTRC genetic system protein E
MFKELASHLENVNMNLKLSLKDDKIAVSVLLKSKKGKEIPELKPLIITGTAEELEEAFPKAIAKAFDANAEAIATVSQWTDSLKEA